MKNIKFALKWFLIWLLAFCSGFTLSVFVSVKLEDMRYREYKRGLFTGADYCQRHGEFPSHWHWNHAFEDENFNIDTILPPAKAVWTDTFMTLPNGHLILNPIGESDGDSLRATWETTKKIKKNDN